MADSTSQAISEYIKSKEAEIRQQDKAEYDLATGSKDFIPRFLGNDGFERWSMSWIIDHCQERDRTGDLSTEEKVQYRRMADEVHEILNRPKNEVGSEKTLSSGDMERIRGVQREFINVLMARVILLQLLEYVRYLEATGMKTSDIVVEKLEILVGLEKGVGPFLFETREVKPTISQEVSEALHEYCVKLVHWRIAVDERLPPIAKLIIDKAREQGTCKEDGRASVIRPVQITASESYDMEWEQVVGLGLKTWGYKPDDYIDELKTRLIRDNKI